MSLTFTDIGTGGSTASASTYGYAGTSGITAAVGDMVVLGVAADNSGTSGVSSTSATITDAAGNTWIRQSVVNNTAGVVNDGTTLSIFTSLITNALSAATVTLNFSPNTPSKIVAGLRIQPGSGETIIVESVGPGVTGNNTTFSTGNVAVTNGHTIIGFAAVESRGAFTGDSDTTNGSWSTMQSGTASTGTGSTSQDIATQHKTVTADGNQSWDPTMGSAQDFALNYLIVYGVSLGVGAAAGTGAAAGVGAATDASVGAAAGTGAATGVGASTAASAGASSGTGSASGVGAATVAASGAASGTGTATGTGASTAAAAGAAAGVGAASAIAAGTFSAAGSAAGQGAASGAGAATTAAAGAASGTGTAAGAGVAAKAAAGAASGHGSASAAGITLIYASLAAVDASDKVAIEIDPAWPAGLPLPTIAGYALKAGAAVLRQAMEMGAARTLRRRPPLPVVSVTWQLDYWQQMLLDGFYKSRVAAGGTWFGTTLALPAGLVFVSARFKDKLSMKAIGGRNWTATATLELRRRPDSLTDAALTTAIGSAGTDWPSDYLPKPLESSWELQPMPELLRSDDLPGLPQQRLRSRNGVTNVSPQWEFTAAEAPIFDAFFRLRGKDGAQWFSMPVYGGIGFTNADTRFTGEATWTPRAGGGWHVEAPIEIRERQVLTADELAWVEGEDPDELFEVIERLNTDMGL